MPVLNPDHLLDQADRLIHPPGGGAPRQADLRRAISNAYYALFHVLATAAADEFVGRTQRHTARYALVYRSFDHRSLKTLCDDVAKPAMPDKYSQYEPHGGFGPDLRNLAGAVADLQEKRHSADYDPLYRVRASDALVAVATARTALASLRNASATRRKIFVSLMVFPPRRV